MALRRPKALQETAPSAAESTAPTRAVAKRTRAPEGLPASSRPSRNRERGRAAQPAGSAAGALGAEAGEGKQAPSEPAPARPRATDKDVAGIARLEPSVFRFHKADDAARSIKHSADAMGRPDSFRMAMMLLGYYLARAPAGHPGRDEMRRALQRAYGMRPIAPAPARGKARPPAKRTGKVGVRTPGGRRAAAA